MQHATCNMHRMLHATCSAQVSLKPWPDCMKQVSLISWPDYSPIITWTIEPGNNNRKVLWAFPWNCFQMRNGPADWPIIEYCA